MALEDFDPFAPAFVADPAAVYRVLRERERAARSERDDAWLVTRYADVHAVLHDHETFSSDDRRALVPNLASRVHRTRTVLSADPPQHGRLRLALARAFATPRIAALRPRIERLADELIDRGLRGGELELMEQVAVPLPLLIVTELLGLDPDAHDRLRGWAEEEMVFINAQTPEAEARRLSDRSAELFAELRAAIARARRGAGPDSLLAELVRTTDEEGRLTEEELLATAGLLVRGGTHTVTHLIGNSVLALVRHRSQLELLRARPELWRGALDELLRHSGPLQSQLRIATRPVQLHGVEIAAGERLQVVLGAANRDPRKFDDPDALRLDRDASEHVGFGGGIHYCLGARLGRIEAQVVLERLLDRMPLMARTEPLEEPEWAWAWTIRGLRRLPLRGGRRSI